MVEALTGARCDLGEGPLWHPGRGALFWFDILDARLYACDAAGGGTRDWSFDEMVSAAGWVDDDTLLLASASGLWRFSIATGARQRIAALESDNPRTRSNDGRAAPDGAFWVGTMGLGAENGAGALYRFADGGVSLVRPGISIPNATAFSPDGQWMYFADTPTGIIRRWRLSGGLPQGQGAVFADLRGTGMSPDGAVCDAGGGLWCALWGGWRVVRFAPDGARTDEIMLPVEQPTCPALGGPGLRRLYVTSARQGLSDAALAGQPLAGAVLHTAVRIPGVPEPRVRGGVFA